MPSKVTSKPNINEHEEGLTVVEKLLTLGRTCDSGRKEKH
jgi:hypothetical protein